jgi:hypothetical protein
MSEPRVRNKLSTPPFSAVKPGSEEPVAASALEIDEVGIRLLIDLFLQLKTWDTLQSTFKPLEAPDYCKDIAA